MHRLTGPGKGMAVQDAHKAVQGSITWDCVVMHLRCAANMHLGHIAGSLGSTDADLDHLLHVQQQQ